MNCPLETRDHGELLVAYSSRKLDATNTALVEEHIANCGACREVVRGQRELWETLDIWEAEPVSADFNRRLYQRIETEVTWWGRLLGPVWPLMFHRGASLAAAAALVLTAGVVLDRTVGPPPKPSGNASQVAAAEGLQPDQVVKALDDLQALSRFNDLMRPESPESKM
jgi:hypothetical protein